MSRVLAAVEGVCIGDGKRFGDGIPGADLKLCAEGIAL